MLIAITDHLTRIGILIEKIGHKTKLEKFYTHPLLNHTYIHFRGEASEHLLNALTIDFCINSSYEHSHWPKINNLSVKICERSRPLLTHNFSIVTRVRQQ
jgi:hypothetical protein